MYHAADVMTIAITNILQKTYPVVWWWDVLRYLSAFSSCLLILAYSRIAFGAERPQSREEVVTIRIGICSYLAAVLPLALTEIQQLGMPIVPWRLPMVVVLNFFGWWYVKRRL